MSLDYSIRVSQRARRLQIKINPVGDVEVILPQGMSASRIVPFVNQHQDWIQKTRSRLRLNFPVDAEKNKQLLPESIEFRACAGVWRVSYHLEPGLRSTMMTSDALLQVCASDETAARQTLHRWLSRKARAYLLPCLRQLSDETGLSFQRLTIRAQKTRWGSCSSTGTISLNRAVMFLDVDMVRYLLVHELCHTREMNHSPRFWALVEQFEPRYRECEERLRRIAVTIPAWIGR